jgi:hypothetical protein
MPKQTCGRIYSLVIASLMVPTVVVALMAERALAAEMPEDFQGTWCTSNDTLKGDWDAYTKSTTPAAIKARHGLSTMRRVTRRWMVADL